jgi:Pentapeptide repeats (8 copies)
MVSGGVAPTELDDMKRSEAIKLLTSGKASIAKWNQRREAGEHVPVLSMIDLSEASLTRANLHGANLRGAVLSGANLSEADLRETNLSHAKLVEANLSGANLSGADLSGNNLREANLRNANLSRADLTRADLTRADLSHFMCLFTIFADTELSGAKGLDLVKHEGPSTISIDTLLGSNSKIPELFLRGCGVPETLIE